MNSIDDGHDPVDPDFAGLFRPLEEPAEPAPAPAPEPEAEPVPVSAAESAPEPEPEPRSEPDPESERSRAPDEPVLAPDEPLLAPVPITSPVADTGRLFRSQGVADHAESVLALPPDTAASLRTLDRRDPTAPSEQGPFPAPEGDHTAAPIDESMTQAGRRRRRLALNRRPGGVTGGAVYLIVIGVTLLVAFVNVLVSGGPIGWPTGLALLASSVYAAASVRRSDDTVAIIVPPVAFLVATLTAGQLFLGSAEGSLVNRAVVAFFTLADNWAWTIGATASALVIVLVRRRRT